MNNTIGKNVLANAAGKIWAVIVSLLFVPIFVKLMGEEQYGIVTFFSVMQTVLNIMGVGLQRTLRRAYAESGTDDSLREKKYQLLRSSEFIYCIVCIIIIVVCRSGASFISNKWLNYETLNSSIVAQSIVLMGCSIGLQLLANLYAGGIFGLDLQVLANGLQIGWMTLKNGGVVIVLLVTSGSVLGFYIWMVIVDAVYCIVLRTILINKTQVKRKFWTIKDLRNLQPIWRYAGGLFFISLGTALSTQLDKVIMSKHLSVVECGAYNNAFHLGSFTAYIPTIIGTAIFSNLVALISQEKHKDAEQLFKLMNRISVIVVSTMAAFITVFSYEIILVWTQSQSYAEIMRYGAPFVVLGYMLNAYQQVPYDYLLASGVTRLNQMLLAVSIPYVATVTVFMTRTYGIIGASLAWFLQLLLLTTVYLLLFYKLSFGRGGLRWLIKDVYGFFIYALIPAILLRLIVNFMNLKPFVIVLSAVTGGGFTLIGIMYIFERQYFLSFLNRCKHICIF